MTLEKIEEIRRKRIKTYHILDFTLDPARDNEALHITGSYIYVLNLDGACSIRLNETSSDSIDLLKFRVINSPFYRFFLTHPAQAGKILKLAIGVESEFFSLQDFQSPDLAILTGYGQELRNNFLYNYGTQIAKSNSASGAIVIVHTVASGKTFLLEWYGYAANFVAATETSILVRNAADVTQYYLMRATPILDNFGLKETPCLISIPADFDIVLTAVGTSGIFANIKGREI